ncbi:MAG: lysophospholipid acyltransferase family protein [Roseiarcus sp.]
MWLSWVLIGSVRALLGATPRWVGSEPRSNQRVYFANHTSHIDTVALWSALPPDLRARTRPAAAADYWGGSALKRYIAIKGLNAVLIDRNRTDPQADPLRPLAEALDRGESIIIFPEGTRRAERLPGPFKSGLYHLAQRFPDVEFIPVYLENLHRSLPKGTLFPVPLICAVRFGAPLPRLGDEEKSVFLERARNAVIGLAR